MRSLSVQWKITLMAGVGILLTVFVLTGLSFYFSSQNQQLVSEQTFTSLRNQSEALVKIQSERQAIYVQQYMDEATYRAEMLAQSVLFLKFNAEENYTNSAELRGSINELLRRSVNNFPNIYSAFVVFEPNALDGEDNNYHDASYVGANSTGRFAPYWSKSLNQQAVQRVFTEEQIVNTSLNTAGRADNDIFSCSALSQNTCVMNPTFSSEESGRHLISSITTPLIVDGKSIGIMGIDIKLNTLQPVINEVDNNLFNGIGKVSLLSNDGTVVAWDQDESRLGDRYTPQDGLPETLPTWLSNGNDFIGWSNNQQWLLAYTPVMLGNTTWGIIVQLPAEQVLEEAIALDSAIQAQRSASSKIQIIASVLIGGFGILVVLFAASRLVAPIKQVVESLKEIASGEGDLTQRIAVTQQDEVGELATWFNRFLDKLQNTIGQVVVTVEEVSKTAGEAAYVASKTRDGSESQFKEVDMVATASEEMTQTSAQVVDHTETAVDAAKKADSAAQQGQQVIQLSAGLMASLVNRMDSAVPIAKELESNSENINEILKVIEGISEQTNLLALNAAIEAARAGDQGRGFAVVADEVRLLASRTKDSVRQIHTVIDDLQQGTRSVVCAIEEGNQLAGDTAEQVSKAVDSLSQITESVGAIQAMNEQIMRAAEEQQAVSGEVNRNVSNIRELSEGILTHAESSADIGQRLTEISERQKALASQFKV
ncbi:methyl-accepting chemotaxis protein [Photobacterium frigidiphilum]|uniref:Methyl-accepting chemotaxis protein n=1 Tax=Photobacterium frigidiphilum TaxID=264736 RepID=A0A2T3JR17_9GAMM|nr:methyl-accepting chemotaxis protein [Photobacterium frigidiphilum]PSU51488.1 methyl-accepting chemotaxis protein [Photobacterium frigidiphilum]